MNTLMYSFLKTVIYTYVHIVYSQWRHCVHLVYNFFSNYKLSMLFHNVQQLPIFHGFVCVCVCVCVCMHACSVVSNSLQPHGLQPTRLLCPWNLRGKKTGVGCHFLCQGIFLTQGSNMHLLYILHQQVDSLPLPTWEVAKGARIVVIIVACYHKAQIS